MSPIQIIVVGAGVVGLAVAYHLVQSGARVIIIDREPEGDKASFGNASGIAVTEVVPASAPGVLWRIPQLMLDPLGPLSVRPTHALRLIPWLMRFAKAGTEAEVSRISKALAAINSRVYADLVPMLDATGLSRELHRQGALTLYESEEGYDRDAAERTCKRSRGVTLQEMSGVEARRMEPALGSRVQRAVYLPEWSHLSDPKHLLQNLTVWLQKRGTRIERGHVLGIASTTSSISLELECGTRMTTDKVVIAAGAWSGRLAKQVGDRVLLESERGYNTTLSQPGIALGRTLIFAERKFVATPLRCGLRIGGAAEFGGLKSSPNFKRSRMLVELAGQYLPELQSHGGTAWAGHRPATPDSLPVISCSPADPRILYAFGHGHLGLTQAATTGRLVSELVFDRTQSIDMRPYSISRFG